MSTQSVLRLVLLTGVIALPVSSPPALVNARATELDDQESIASLIKSGTWNTFIAEYSVSVQHVDKAGVAIGYQPPPQNYRIERTETAAGWKTVLIMSPLEVAVVKGNETVSTRAKRMPATIVDGGDGSSTRVYDADGKLLDMPRMENLEWTLQDSLKKLGYPSEAQDLARKHPFTGAPLAPVIPHLSAHDRSWLRAYFQTPADQANRRVALSRVVSAGKLGTLNRYLSSSLDNTTEFLVDADTDVIVEMNTVKGGKLQTHTNINFERQQDGTMVCRSIRTERIVSTDSGERVVSSINYRDLRLEWR